MNTAPALKMSFDLCLSSGRSYVVRRFDEQRVAALSSGEAVALGLMNGTRSLDSLRSIFAEALPQHGNLLLSTVMARLKPLLSESIERTDYPPISLLAKAIDPEPIEGLRRFPGPRVLHWAVTRFCPKRCAYCFAEPVQGGRAKDAVITRIQLERIWKEAVELGGEYLLVAGAEPLLREDLPEVLGDALQAGLTILLTTKHPISRKLATRFAAAGVPHLSLSLDSMDQQENARLIGTERYVEQVKLSVRNLNRVGVAFSIQSVVSRLNPTAAYEVAAFAASEGAKVMQIVPFKPIRQPISGLTNNEMQLDQEDYLDNLVFNLQHLHPNLRIEKFVEPGESGDGYHCDIGQTKLFFLPDGVVHRCYKLTDDITLRGADLREVSVASAWHDPAFYHVVSPPRSAYINSSCCHCKRFVSCSEDGRCIFESLMRSRTYFGADRSCGGPH